MIFKPSGDISRANDVKNFLIAEIRICDQGVISIFHSRIS